MIKELKPHVAAYVQQLVGGNANLESKLQALLPGVFADTGATGKTDRRLHDLAVAVDEKRGRSVLLIETLGSDGLRYWSYSSGQLKADDIFDVYKPINDEKELSSWGIVQLAIQRLPEYSLDDLWDWWGGGWEHVGGMATPPYDINIFDGCTFFDPDGPPGLHCSIYIGKYIQGGIVTYHYESPSFTCRLPDWLYQELASKKALESGAAD